MVGELERAHATLEAQAARSALLGEVSRQLARDLNLGIAASEVTRTIAGCLGECGIRLLSRTGGTWISGRSTAAAPTGMSAATRLAGFRLKADAGWVGTALRGGSPIRDD